MLRIRRTPIDKRTLPGYSPREERFNTVSHAIGAGLAAPAMVLCIVFAAIGGDPWTIVCAAVYGLSLVTMYVVSSVYHGISKSIRAKKIMQVLDHCMIYFLIIGCYMPILLCAVRKLSSAWAWNIFGLIFALAAFGVTFTAIDHRRYWRLSYTCIGILAASFLLATPLLIPALTFPGFLLLAAGGVVYLIGGVFYRIGWDKDNMHAVFHVFVIIGSLLHFACIFFYVLK